MYGRESWVITESRMKVLEVFHHQVTHIITGKKSWRVGAEVWEWSTIEEALEAPGMWTMREYVMRCKSIIKEYITMRLIYELCTNM